MVYTRTMTTLTMDLARGAFRLWCTVLDGRVEFLSSNLLIRYKRKKQPFILRDFSENLRRRCNREMTEKILSPLYSRRADIKLCFTLALTRMPEAAAYGFAAYPRSASSFDELQSAPPPPTPTRAANSNDNIRRGEEAERELSANEASAARSSLTAYSLFDISRGACHSKQSRKSNRRYNAHTHTRADNNNNV
uniref:Uncharacterized protein n=1 Tax=Trichogramma kaykai TaxID=54128 RepID=A0ABD2XKD1_9HYME